MCGFSDSQTDVYDLAGNIRMDIIVSLFVVIVVGLRIYQEHMIEQEGSLDRLRMLGFMHCFKVVLYIMVTSSKNIEHDFRKMK